MVIGSPLSGCDRGAVRLPPDDVAIIVISTRAEIEKRAVAKRTVTGGRVILCLIVRRWRIFLSLARREDIVDRCGMPVQQSIFFAGSSNEQGVTQSMSSYAQGLTREPWKPELAYSSLMGSGVEVI